MKTKRGIYLFIFSIFLAACSIDSDESIIRDEFHIPSSAKLLHFSVFPKESGWFGREGLKIDAAFELNDEDFSNYLEEAKKSNQWLPLPIPRDFLMKMFSIKSAKEYRIRYYKDQNKPLPEGGSVYNPTEEQILERVIQTLPVSSGNGIFILKASGTDIMNAPKKTYKKLNADLKDFMLGVFDFDQKKLFIKVSTSY